MSDYENEFDDFDVSPEPQSSKAKNAGQGAQLGGG